MVISKKQLLKDLTPTHHEGKIKFNETVFLKGTFVKYALMERNAKFLSDGQPGPRNIQASQFR